MTSRIATTTINCHDAHALSEWWKQVLDYQDLPDSPNRPGDEECFIHDPTTGHELLFILVEDLQEPEGRVHFDLVPEDRTRDEEVERVLQLGATHVTDLRNPDGTGWVVMADPEGNRFCIVRSDAERVTTQA